MEAGEATSFPVVSTMATKRMTDTTTGVELTDSWKEPLNRDPSVTGEDEETEDYDGKMCIIAFSMPCMKIR